MYLRIAAAVAFVASAAPVLAEEMKAEEARHFVMGKMFSYTCFEGTRGAGRIYSDGSVAGTIQIRGSGPVHYVRLPANTLHAKGESVCATVRGLPIQPCFTLKKTSQDSFRGSIYGLSFAYCEFNRQGHRIEVGHRPSRPSRPMPQMQLRTAIDTP